MPGEAFWRPTSTGGGASSFDDLTDVDMTTVAPTDGQVPVFDNADSTWKPGTVSGGGGAGVGARAFLGANQSVPVTTVVTVPLSEETYDTDSIHDTATNNSRMTVPVGMDGLWLVTGTLTWSTSGGERQCRLNVNGTMASLSSISVTGGLRQQCTDIFNLAAGDYVELAAYQTSGTQTLTGGEALSHLAASFLG